MVEHVPQSLNRQMIYAIIPILYLYAFYKVKKLRMYLLITIMVGFIVGFTIRLMFSIIFGEITYAYELVIYIISIAVNLGMHVYLIRRWTVEWNRQF